MQVYDAWMKSYLNGDVKTYDSFLDDDYRFIGSTNNEEFLNKNDTTNFFKATADQLAGKTEIRNSNKTIEQIDGLVFITDLFDAYFLDGDDWAYYGRFRFTSAMRKNKNGWRFIYQHFSIPDSKAQQGETLGVEQISKENQELREAIKRRTIELEQKNRELEIEAALEKVRSRSLAMHNPEELQEVVAVVAKKLKELGVIFDAGGVILCTYFPDNKDVIHWISVDDFSSSGRYFVPYFDNPIFSEAWDSKNRGDAYFSKAFPVAAKNEFFKHAFKNSDYRQMPEDYKQFVLKADSHNLSAAWSKNSAILIPSLAGVVPSESDAEIMKRFAKVFEQAYTRFLDLQKAEAQAREAQIEAALERVRSRSMAMHTTSELQEVIETVHKEFNTLNIAITGGVFIAINEDIKKEINCWGAGGTTNYIERVHIPFLNSPIYTGMIKKIQKGSGFFIEEFSNAQKKKFFEHLFKHPPYSNTSKKHKDEVINREGGYTRSCAVSENTSIFMINHHGEKFSETDNEILKRFAKVFEQTYTRFLDLQKAEAQTREAQIEVALEKVRSRTMAMQKGEEVKDVVVLLYKELIALGVTNFATCGYVEVNEKTNRQLTWVTSPGGDSLGLFHLPLTGDAVFDERYEAWKRQQIVFHQTVAGKKRLKHLEYAITTFNSKEAEEMVLNQFPDPTVFYCFNFSHGYLHLVAGSELNEEEESLLARFTKIFEQTYARFLDLQKAEAQAREAQIENALEKVRSRTMAMQQSDELPEAANNLFLQVQGLGIPAWSAGYCIWRNDKKSAWSNMSSEGVIQKPFAIPNIGEGYNFQKPFKNGEAFHVQELGGKALVKHYEFMRTIPIFGEVIDGIIEAGYPLPKFQIFHIVYFTHGYLMFITYEPVPNDWDIFKRFGNVFEQTYTRFLDLQKSEAQTREAEIELALERVRARTMAMHKSQELAETALVLYEQFAQLGNIPDRMSIGIFKEESKEIELWSTDQFGSQLNQKFAGSWKKSPVWTKLYKAWKAGNDSLVADLSGQGLKEWLKFIREEVKLFVDDTHIKGRRVQQAGFFSHGILLLTTNEPIAEEIMQLLIRFAKVFSQTYTRFLDLQKAEAQAREAQIEAALEKVRSRSLAMHRSDEMQQVANEVYEQMIGLGLEMYNVGMSGVIEAQSSYEIWVGGSELSKPLTIPYTDSTQVQREYNKAIKKRLELFARTYSGKVKKEYIDFLLSENAFPDSLKKLMLESNAFSTSLTFAKNSGIQLVRYTEEPYSEEDNTILIRFAKVFEQAYIRFMDLQKAEAQTKEAQVEGALERVRSKTMAMHNSKDLEDIVISLFDEVLNLGIDKSIRCGIGILEDHEGMETRSVNSNADGTVELRVGMLNMTIHPMLVGLKKAWKKGSKGYSYDYIGKDVRKYYEALNNEPEYPFNANLETLPEREFHRSFFYSSGILFAFSENPITEESSKILARFAAVFGQTYRRFLDLQKAEAQAREAQIELSLERIRAQAMAMKQSSDLLDIVVTMRSEFVKLGHEAHYFWHMRWLPDTYEKAMTSGDGARIGSVMVLPRDFHSHYKGMTQWENNKEPVMILPLETEMAVDYIEKMITLGNFQQVDPNAPTLDDVRHIKGLTFVMARTTHGEIGYSLPGVVNNPPAEDLNILVRFAGVFDLAHRRFEDLQKAEAREKEAIKQSSLDRVRAEIASMRTTDDLDRITPLIWSELTSLGVPFFRCGIFIIREEEKMVHTYLSTPSGKSLGALHIGFHETEVELIQQIITNWRKQEIYSEEWDQEQFVENMGSFMKRGHIESPEKYQAGDTPPENLVLQFVPFEQGMLYAGNSEPLIPEHIELMKDLAKAFSVAYSRYEDFNELEKAKSKVEVTLTDLKSTQNQLVQSEKMASLGELTAGIAHEIQNPLNFVNNFSEVSKELIEEMMEEMEKGDVEEVKALADDIIQNLEKIHHHGQRADGIVKGMLQHSRTSSGEKELTDINVLANEYLRLAYHGLRAKDKSFNATLETHYDENIEKVNVIPQDMGRVILNLITNAFYVVKEKSSSAKASGDTKYEPTVTVTTKKEGDTIFVSVKDNGNGIPQKVLDKIFQPFFTTKPTGQGTGLGLSLSYDIVKVHGGKLKVKTKEGEGTDFIINLPVS